MKLTKWQQAKARKQDELQGGFWLTLLAYGLLFALSELLRPKPNIENAKPPGLGDFQFPTTTEDRVVPLVWGTVLLKGPNVVWYGDLRKRPIKKKIRTGLFSSKKQTVGYKYDLGVQMALSRGPLDRMDGIFVGEDTILSRTAIRNIRIVARGTGYSVGDVLTLVGGTGTAATVQVTVSNYFRGLGNESILAWKLKSAGDYTSLPTSGSTLTTTGGTGSGATFSIESGVLDPDDTFTFNLPDLFGGDEEGQGGISGTLKFHAGELDQDPSTYLENFQLEDGKTPAYRGTAYIAPNSSPFYLGNSTSIAPWSFEVRRIPNGLALTGGDEVVNTYDCNPMNVLYEILTEPYWGMGHDAADIDTTSFTSAAATLATEGNGFSFTLDREMPAQELIAIVEQQISGKLFFNQTLSQWQVKLARADYVLADIPVITESNAIEIKDFTRGSWEDTTNIVHTKFTNRENEYSPGFGLAQDNANIANQDGVNVSTTVNLPGVKNADLANEIAWRTLRTLSYPLAKATFVMNRSFYDTNPVDVFAFTSAKYGLTKLPMRVTRVDLGTLEDNRVTLDCVQDVFFFQAGSFGAPGGTGWTRPQDDLLPFDSDKQLAFEAPRGIVQRQPEPSLDPLIMASARRKGSESGFLIVARDHATTPAGAFGGIGEVDGFMLIGELNATLSAGQTSPVTSITITNAVDEQADIIDAFFVPTSTSDLGTNLVNLIYVTDGTNDGEFMLVRSASVNGASNVDLEDVYRGVLDSAQQSFSAGDSVYLLFAGANVSDALIDETNAAEVKLLPQSATDLVAPGDATTISFTMDKRVRRPYCPSEVTVGTTRFGSTVSLEQTGSGLDGVGFAVDFIRRDYRVTDEIPQLTIDAETNDSTFPAANDTDHDIQVRDDPDGANTLLFTDTDVTGTSNDLNRTAILHAAAGSLPTRLRLVLTAKHDDGADTDLTSRQSLVHDFDVTSSLTGQTELGDLLRNVASASYSVDTPGVHTITIGTALGSTGAGSGDVEININSGGWVQIIAQGNLSNTTASLSVSDTIELRHDSTEAGDVTMVTITGGTTDAWGIFYV